jgi:mono/diheme cytochrome c family protein
MMRLLILRVAAIAALAGALPAAAQNVANGQAIFHNICIHCHGFPPSGGPERAGGNPALIRAARS